MNLPAYHGDFCDSSTKFSPVRLVDGIDSALLSIGQDLMASETVFSNTSSDHRYSSLSIDISKVNEINRSTDILLTKMMTLASEGKLTTSCGDEATCFGVTTSIQRSGLWYAGSVVSMIRSVHKSLF